MGSCKTGKKVEHFALLGPTSSHKSHIEMALWPLLSTLHNCDAFPPSTGWHTIQSTMTLQVSQLRLTENLLLCLCCVTVQLQLQVVDVRRRGLLTSIRTSVAICHVTGPRTALQRLAGSWSIKCCRSISDISSVDQCRPLQHRHRPPWREIIYCYCNWVITCSFIQQKWVWVF